LQNVNFNPTGAFLLGAAIAKIFPQEEICYSEADGQGFMVEFTHAQPFQENYLSMLENAMKALSGEEIKLMEMVASNACEWMLHKGQKKWAAQLEGVQGTVLIGQIGNFVGLCLGPIEECHHFSLFEFVQEKKRVTIFGMAFGDVQEQKSFLKKYRQYPKKNHAFLAKELELYEDDIWHPRGMALKRALVDLSRQRLEREGYYEISTPDPKGYFEQTGRKKFSCGDRNFCFSEDALISSLHFIQKWINIFDFELKWVLVISKPIKALINAMATCGIQYLTEEGEGDPRVELRIADCLGRYWTGPTLWLKKNGLEFSLFGDLERFIALLLERYEGELPFWITPEQVRLLPLEGVDIEPVMKIFSRQKIRCFVDGEPGLLKEKMHRALRAKAPYVMVFGKREENARQMNVRSQGLDRTMTLEQLEQFLAERQLENQ
jgi:threonyl-tRNA synthetase